MAAVRRSSVQQKFIGKERRGRLEGRGAKVSPPLQRNGRKEFRNGQRSLLKEA